MKKNIFIIIVYEIINGFYPEIFNKIDEKILKKIIIIPNLDFIKCSCYDASLYQDIIYIFNKIKRGNNKNILKIDSKIANLLSYDKIKRSY